MMVNLEFKRGVCESFFVLQANLSVIRKCTNNVSVMVHCSYCDFILM